MANFLRRYWRGEGRLCRVYWLYGVLGSFVLALILGWLLRAGAIGSGWFQIVLMILAAYTVWIVVSVWRCAFNVDNELYGHMARWLTVAWALNALFVLGFLEVEFFRTVG